MEEASSRGSTKQPYKIHIACWHLHYQKLCTGTLRWQKTVLSFRVAQCPIGTAQRHLFLQKTVHKMICCVHHNCQRTHKPKHTLGHCSSAVLHVLLTPQTRKLFLHDAELNTTIT